MTMQAPPILTVILQPAPQLRDRIFTPATLARLESRFRVIDLEADLTPGAFDAHLPEAFAIIGQPDMPAKRLEAAGKLRAILNVEGNFFPNIDYPFAFERGVRVLGCGTAYGQAVAEYSLALALDLARGITREDRAGRSGVERYVSASNSDAILLRHATVGIIGYGNLGRALRALLMPFGNAVRVFDPWLPASIVEDANAIPSSLDDLLTNSDFVFVFATATADSEHLLDAQKLALLRPGVRLVLVSRSAVVDYDALLVRVEKGDIHVGIDVWPVEPLPQNSPFRRQENVILSAHRAGGIPQAFYSIGEMVCDDLELMAQGLPPARMQIAAPELVGRYRNRPVS